MDLNNIPIQNLNICMKNQLPAITATLQDLTMLKNLVEELAGWRYDSGYAVEKTPPGWNAIDTSSIEVYVSGDVCFSGNDRIVIPFNTNFLFTCTKKRNDNYTLCWATSLS
jgi:hypothetical protein